MLTWPYETSKDSQFSGVIGVHLPSRFSLKNVAINPTFSYNCFLSHSKSFSTSLPLYFSLFHYLSFFLSIFLSFNSHFLYFSLYPFSPGLTLIGHVVWNEVCQIMLKPKGWWYRWIHFFSLSSIALYLFEHCFVYEHPLSFSLGYEKHRDTRNRHE